MKNYSRTAVLIPFSENQKKVAEKQSSDDDLTLNPDKFKGVIPEAVIGSMYPDLCSQAAYINKDIDDTKTIISELVKDLFALTGEKAIKMVLDSAYGYVDKSLDLPEFRGDADDEYVLSKTMLYDLESNLYCRLELAKSLLDLYLKKERMKELRDRQKLAQQNILL